MRVVILALALALTACATSPPITREPIVLGPLDRVLVSDDDVDLLICPKPLVVYCEPAYTGDRIGRQQCECR